MGDLVFNPLVYSRTTATMREIRHLLTTRTGGRVLDKQLTSMTPLRSLQSGVQEWFKADAEIGKTNDLAMACLDLNILVSMQWCILVYLGLISTES